MHVQNSLDATSAACAATASRIMVPNGLSFVPPSFAAILDHYGGCDVSQLQVPELFFPPDEPTEVPRVSSASPLRGTGQSLRQLCVGVRPSCESGASIISASTVLAQRSAWRRVGKLVVRAGNRTMRTWTGRYAYRRFWHARESSAWNCLTPLRANSLGEARQYTNFARRWASGVPRPLGNTGCSC